MEILSTFIKDALEVLTESLWLLVLFTALFPSDFDKQRGRNEESKANQSGRG